MFKRRAFSLQDGFKLSFSKFFASIFQILALLICFNTQVYAQSSSLTVGNVKFSNVRISIPNNSTLANEQQVTVYFDYQLSTLDCVQIWVVANISNDGGGYYEPSPKAECLKDTGNTSRWFSLTSGKIDGLFFVVQSTISSSSYNSKKIPVTYSCCSATSAVQNITALTLPSSHSITLQPLLKPSSANPIVSKTVYQNGDTIKVTLPDLPTGIDQYFALSVPNYGLFTLNKLNNFNLFNNASLPKWQGDTNVVDLVVNQNIPRGKYDAYLLRTFENADPFKAANQAFGSNQFTVIDDVQMTHIADPSVPVGLVARSGDEVMGIFGKKDSEGRLTKVEGITFSHQKDASKKFIVELDDNYLPKRIVGADNSSVEIVNSTGKQRLTYKNPQGKVLYQTEQPVSSEKLQKAAEAVKKYVESPQPTQNNSVPTSSGTTSPLLGSNQCVDEIKEFHQTAKNLFWGASQLLSIASCTAGIAETVATLGVAFPLMFWGCSSIILNGADHFLDAVTDGKSPIGKLNEGNSLVSGAVSCAVGDKFGCVQGLAETIMGSAFKATEPEIICKKGETFVGEYLIKANQGWQGIPLGFCKSIIISASGSWNNYNGRDDYGPDGRADKDNGVIFPQANVGALIGKANDGSIFVIGSGITIDLQNTETLSLSMNDWGFENNHGQMKVKITSNCK